MLLFCAVTDNTLREVAKDKPSFQVSKYNDQHPASHANDGNRHTCAVSKPETNPWWSVDLEGPTLVFLVKLTNAGDDKGRLFVSGCSGYVVSNRFWSVFSLLILCCVLN